VCLCRSVPLESLLAGAVAPRAPGLIFPPVAGARVWRLLFSTCRGCEQLWLLMEDMYHGHLLSSQRFPGSFSVLRSNEFYLFSTFSFRFIVRFTILSRNIDAECSILFGAIWHAFFGLGLLAVHDLVFLFDKRFFLRPSLLEFHDFAFHGGTVELLRFMITDAPRFIDFLEGFMHEALPFPFCPCLSFLHPFVLLLFLPSFFSFLFFYFLPISFFYFLIQPLRPLYCPFFSKRLFMPIFPISLFFCF